MPARKSAVSGKKSPEKSAKKSAAKSRSSSTRAGAKTARKAPATKGRGAAKKTITAKTGAKSQVKKATKPAAKKSTPSRVGKAKPAKKKAARKPATAASKPKAAPKSATRATTTRRTASTKSTGAKTARPKAVATKRTTIRKSKAAAAAPKQAAPRLAPARKRVDAPQVAAGEQEQLRTKLLAEREQVVRLYENDMRMSLLPDQDVTDDLVDRATSAYNRELHFAISDGERERLVLIDQALERLSQNAFGTCLACKRPVPSARLQAVPWARYCTDCQELAEKGQLREP